MDMDENLYNWAEKNAISFDSSNPLQTSLLVSSFFHSEQHENFLNNVINSLAAHAKSDENDSMEDDDNDTDNNDGIASLVMNRLESSLLSPSSSSLTSMPASLTDGMVFAGELLNLSKQDTTNVINKKTINDTHRQLDSTKLELEELKRQNHGLKTEIDKLKKQSNQYLQQQQLRQKHDDDEDEQKSKKNNPFQTAKTQYIKEGGNLDALKQDKVSSSSLSLVKKALNTRPDDELPPELAKFDKEIVSRIMADILDNSEAVKFDDIAGLEFAKKCVIEMICWPMAKPDLFSGLRRLPKGMLLFGPPGTGKTLIGKAIAHQAGATFFSISSSSMTSKWIGEGEKTVRTLFAVAGYKQPSVVFIDEVDSLLCQRSSDENEASRRLKTEFLIQLDGAGTDTSARVVIIGATNRPDELDEAARRRFVKRIYIPLPDGAGRQQLLNRLLLKEKHNLDESDIESVVAITNGYSGADIKSLCTEAAMFPLREVADGTSLIQLSINDIPPITAKHFEYALENVLPTVSTDDLLQYKDWNTKYGSFRKSFTDHND